MTHTAKDDEGEKVSSAKETVGRKRKAAASVEDGKKESTESSSPLQYCHWLMKSEPESRFENGIDVKVQSSDSLIRTVCC